ncbi:MAG: hydroxymethylbilane synthase [Acidimicrobiia bacterium]|nr:hydroxymethylbilane synthase [Acidimicrobiia bacterium]
MADLRLATRGSRLAIAQAVSVADRLTAAHEGLTVELVEVSTTGDRDRVTDVTSLTEVGAFVRAVQQAVLDGEADAAVHSCKDLPVAGPDGLRAVYPEREAPWDVLCGATLAELPEGARVGTGSPRREAQLGRLRPDLRITGIRGNVDTRLGRVAAGDYDAVVLAEAGLRRLGLEAEITARFTLEEMVPAPAQAALAVEADPSGPAWPLVAAIDDPATRRVVEAERWILARTGAGCRSALGVLAEDAGGTMTLTGFVSDDAGARRAVVERADGATAADALVEALELST